MVRIIDGQGRLITRILFLSFFISWSFLLMIVVMMFGSGWVQEFGFSVCTLGSGVIMWLSVSVCYQVFMIG